MLYMAGRVSEGIFCQDVSAGAQNDIQAATKLARRMVTQWGMSERIGPVCYSDEEEHIFLGNEITRPKHHGEQVSQEIDEEIKSLLDQSYGNAEEMCRAHSRELEALAHALLKLETLTVDEVRTILDGGDPDDLLHHREKEAAREAARHSAGDVAEGPAAGDVPAPAGSPA
jgi:cell division protease FtsH